MSKGIAQQLIDGSANIDRMEKDIVKIVQILKSAMATIDFSNEDLHLNRESTPSHFDIIVSDKFTWRVYPHYVTSKVVIHGRKHNIIILESFNEIPEITVLANDVQEVHAYLDELVSGMCDQLPILKTHLTLLLNAAR